MNNDNSTARKHIACAAALLGAACISFSAVFARLSENGFAMTGFYRVFFGALLFSLVYRKDLRAIHALRGETVFCLSCCALFFALDLLLWHHCIALAGPALATVLNNLSAPLVILLGAIFLGERVRTGQVMILPLMFFGLWMLACPGDAADGGAILSGCGSALSYAGFIIFLKRARSQGTISAHSAMIICSALSCIPLFAIARITGEPTAIPSAAGLVVLFAYALVCHVIGWGLISFALGEISAPTAAMLLLAQPALSYLWDIFLFGKQLTPREGFGSLILLFAIAVCARRSAERSPDRSCAPSIGAADCSAS